MLFRSYVITNAVILLQMLLCYYKSCNVITNPVKCVITNPVETLLQIWVAVLLHIRWIFLTQLVDITNVVVHYKSE